MRNWVKAASLWLLAAFVACGCAGETENTSKEELKEKASNVNLNIEFDEKENDSSVPNLGFLAEPFDPTVTELPPGFRGCDIWDVYERIGEHEREATEENIADKTLTGRIKYSSTLAFTLPALEAGKTPNNVSENMRRNGALNLFTGAGEAENVVENTVLGSYDENTNILEYKVPVWGIKEKTGIELQAYTIVNNKYAGETTFGRYIDVERKYTLKWGILFDIGGDVLTWRLRGVSKEKATEIYTAVGIVCVCKLKIGEKREVDGTSATPTLGNPQEVITVSGGIAVTEPEFWLYNVKTGEIYAKYSLEEGNEGTVKDVGDLTPGDLTPVRTDKDSLIVYASEPFDLNDVRIPANYRGHDPEAIYNATAELIDESKLKKDEFEKTSEYIERIDKMLQEETLLGDIKLSSWLAFAFAEHWDYDNLSDIQTAKTRKRHESLVELFSEYDADKETMMFQNSGAALSVNNGKTSETTPSFTLSDKLYGLYFKNVWPSRWGIVFGNNDILGCKFVLKEVEPSVAKELIHKIGVLAVCKLSWRKNDKGELIPRFCFENGSHKAVYVTEPIFWLYNVETGEVLAKYSLDEVQKGTPKSIGDTSVNLGTAVGKIGENADELRDRLAGARGSGKVSSTVKNETAEEKAEREAKEASAGGAKERRRAAEFWENGNKRLDNRLAAVKRLTSSREVDAPLTIAVPGDFATLQDALAEAAKAPYNGPIPRIVLDAGEYDASGLTLKTFVDVQSASGKPEDVVLTVDAASPITVDGETVVSFDGVALRQVGGGAKSGACVEVKRGVALFFGCAFDGKSGASSATGVKAVGLKSAAVLHKCRATGFSLSALHVEDGAFAWAVESVFGPKNRFGASSKAARLEAEKCEFRGNETALYFRGIATGGASGNQYAENKRDAQIVVGAKVEVDAPNVEEK